MDIYYKVVKRTKNGLVSCVMSNLNMTATEDADPQICLNYRVGRWTRPKIKNSKIFIFKSLDSAKYFAEVEHGIVYKCYALNVQRVTCYIARPSNQEIKKYWQNIRGMAWSAPQDTYFADKVFLLEKVK